MTIIVLFNTGVLAFDVNNDISQIDFMSICNFIITGLFAMEMILKFIAYGIKRYFKDPLNSLDAIIVTMSLVEFVTTFGFENQNKKHDSMALKYSIFRTIKVFRVLRFLRMARLLR
jgi:voltage-gated sodium channel